MLRPPPTHTLFPYTTLFRSCGDVEIIPVRDVDRALVGKAAVAAQVHHAVRLPGIDRAGVDDRSARDRKSTRLNSSHSCKPYAEVCLRKSSRRIEQSRAAGAA